MNFPWKFCLKKKGESAHCLAFECNNHGHNKAGKQGNVYLMRKLWRYVFSFYDRASSILSQCFWYLVIHLWFSRIRFVIVIGFVIEYHWLIWSGRLCLSWCNLVWGVCPVSFSESKSSDKSLKLLRKSDKSQSRTRVPPHCQACSVLKPPADVWHICEFKLTFHLISSLLPCPNTTIPQHYYRENS